LTKRTRRLLWKPLRKPKTGLRRTVRAPKRKTSTSRRRSSATSPTRSRASSTPAPVALEACRTTATMSRVDTTSY
ncbi:hypothetical protein LTR16_010083, partial [Cryomyces antarcticus]